MKGVLKNEQIKEEDKNSRKNQAQKEKEAKDKADKNDYQLVRALDLVKALYIYGQNDNLAAQANKENEPDAKDNSDAKEKK